MRTVLIADDDENIIQGLLAHVPWKEIGLDVIGTTLNGADALDLILEQQPDILITDVYMPMIDGLELTERLRSLFPNIYIIIHSGYDDFDNARLAMRYGVQHFLLKPCPVQEIVKVLQEISHEIEVQEERNRLLKHSRDQLQQNLQYMKDAFIRELITIRHNPSNISEEKLRLLQLSKQGELIVASISLIRPPYLSKSKEREWQLMKFGASNIIQEMLQKARSKTETDYHVVDYSDSTFVLVCFASSPGQDLEQISRSLCQRMADNILLYLKLSLMVGIGLQKTGVHEMITSFLESQRALEAAEFQEINKVYTFSEERAMKQLGAFAYPIDMLKELQLGIEQKDSERVLTVWDQFDAEVLLDQSTPLYVVQNICVSAISAFMLEYYTNHRLEEEKQAMSDWIKQVYAQRTRQDLSQWMKEQLRAWLRELKEELTGRKSHKLIRDVKEYVQKHYEEEFTLAEIADSLYVNRNYLSQLFKRVTAESFVSYLNNYRIDKAKELLREKQYMVYEVSEMVGYQNPTYFSQVFKSITGVSPSDY